MFSLFSLLHLTRFLFRSCGNFNTWEIYSEIWKPKKENWILWGFYQYLDSMKDFNPPFTKWIFRNSESVLDVKIIKIFDVLSFCAWLQGEHNHTRVFRLSGSYLNKSIVNWKCRINKRIKSIISSVFHIFTSAIFWYGNALE